MIRKLRELFAMPEFDDPDQNLTARLLSAILATIVGLTLFLTYPLALMLPRGGGAIALQGTAALLLAGVLYFLLRQRKIEIASWALISLFWVLNLTAVWSGGGIDSAAYSNFMLLILTAGLLIGERAGVVFTVLSVLFGLAMVIAQNNGLLTKPIVQQTPFTRWLGTAAIFVMIALLQGFASRITRDALQRARQSEALAKQELAERRRMEEELRLSEERYRLVSSVISDYSFSNVENEKGEIVLNWVAGAFEKISGYTPEEFNARGGWISTVYPDDLEQDERDMQTLNRNQKVVSEIRTIHKDGSIHWVRNYAHPVWDERENKLVGIYGAVQDITEQKQIELDREKLIAELEAKNSEMERFVYTVSHDLKSPIVTIVGFLGYLEDDVLNGNMEAFKKDLERVYQAAYKMQDLLKDLLELSRIGRMMNAPETISFDALINEALELTEGRLQERRVSVHIQQDLPNVYGDHKRLLELMQNLIDNAAKYMGEQPDPSIEIGLRGFSDSKPIFFVKDNGIGIAREYHERVFGLFNKLDPKSEGTGVGLALVKRIVEVHGGKIWIESDAGVGTTFLFTLQTHEAPVTPSQT